jgi:hypothetical protein
MVARVGLGVFEAGFGPGIPLYFSRHLSITRHNTLTLAYYSIVLYEARARLTPCLLVRIRSPGRRIWRCHCLWDTTRSRYDRELASAFHYRGLFLRVTVPCLCGSFNTLVGHSRGSPRSRRHIFPARSARNNRFFDGGRAGACFGSGQSRY